MSFENRDRYQTFEEVKEILKKNIGWICHILYNDDDKSFSIMRHINCEWCDYCEQNNIAYKNGLRYSDEYPLVHLAKQNPYEGVK